MRLEARDIHKHYGPKKANAGISLTIQPGNIHGVLGENGAGKSTLMKILSGYTTKTSGTILLDGRPREYQSPSEASRLGIGMLYQDPLDFPPLTVLENFMIGQTAGLKNDERFFRETFAVLNDQFNFFLHPNDNVRSLTVGARQQLDILRLLALGTKVLILDEPTTGITGEQKTLLFQALRKLASEGKSVILVSHKLQDAETLCDAVTVLREGRVSGSMKHPFDTKELLEMMFDVLPVPPSRSAVEYGATALSMKAVSAPGGRTGLIESTVAIKAGEMVGLAGLEGSGQEVILRVAGGLTKPFAGSIEIFGQEVQGEGPHVFKKSGVVFLPTARLEEGLMPGLNIMEHFALQDRTAGLFVKWREAYEITESRIGKFRIVGNPQTIVESLSGGNQQRLLLSLISEESALLLLEQPTRGLDVESAHWVWQYLHSYCQRRTSIVFSSSDIEEIMMVADRILVFFNGRIVMDVQKEDTDAGELGRMIAGQI